MPSPKGNLYLVYDRYTLFGVASSDVSARRVATKGGLVHYTVIGPVTKDATITWGEKLTEEKYGPNFEEGAQPYIGNLHGENMVDGTSVEEKRKADA